MPQRNKKEVSGVTVLVAFRKDGKTQKGLLPSETNAHKYSDPKS